MQRHRGFTLIELLVVMVILGIIIGTAVLSLNTGDISAEMEIETRRIYRLIQLARDEAILQGQEWAMTVEQDQYLFESLKERQWQPIAGDNVFRTHKIKPGMQLVLRVDDVSLDVSKRNEDERDSKRPARIFILSSGEMSPFELIVRTEDESVQFRIKANESGTMQMMYPQDLS